MSVTNGIVSSKIDDKQDDFNFEIVNFPFLDRDFPRSPSYDVYVSLLICFGRVCSNFSDRFKKIIKRCKKVGYNLNIMRRSACLVVNPITVNSYGFHFNCMAVGQAEDSVMVLT